MAKKYWKNRKTMQIKVKVTGLQELIENNKKAINALRRGIFTEALAKKIKRRAKYRAPRKTGKMIRRIDYKMVNPNLVKFICDAVNDQGVAYPAILEFGLSRFIPIGSAESPRIILSGNGKTAYLPFYRWAIHITLIEKDKIFKKTILKYYK